jgi:hypothetical protein
VEASYAVGRLAGESVRAAVDQIAELKSTNSSGQPTIHSTPIVSQAIPRSCATPLTIQMSEQPARISVADSA